MKVKYRFPWERITEGSMLNVESEQSFLKKWPQAKFGSVSRPQLSEDEVDGATLQDRLGQIKDPEDPKEGWRDWMAAQMWPLMGPVSEEEVKSSEPGALC